jgi:tripartite-type tricarboxylate transporter receptor subunit TctC
VIDAVHRAAAQALAVPETRERFAQLGFVIIGNTPQEFAAVVKSEVAKYRRIIKESGIELL